MSTPLHSCLRRISLAVAAVGGWLMASHAFIAGAAEPPELTKLRNQYNEALDRAEQPLNIFWGTYVIKLKGLKKAAKPEVAFEAVPAIDAEIASTKDGRMTQGSTYAPLRELQASYGRIHDELAQQVEAGRRSVNATYADALNNLEKSFREQKRTEDADKVRDLLKALQQGKTPVAPAGVPSPPSSASLRKSVDR